MSPAAQAEVAANDGDHYAPLGVSNKYRGSARLYQLCRADYGATEGNLGFQMLLRDLKDGTTEVVTLSWWTSIDAVRAFAGEDYERARYYPEDDRYLLEKPGGVEHYDVVIDSRRQD
jgi:heme-degrading monooxygenase HmoA